MHKSYNYSFFVPQVWELLLWISWKHLEVQVKMLFALPFSWCFGFMSTHGVSWNGFFHTIDNVFLKG